MADRQTDRATDQTDGAPRDAGKTSGGGSLGHDQPAEVAEQTNVRNQATRRDDTGQTRDPALPADDATLNTKI